MSTRLAQLVESFGGQLIGDPEIVISGIAPLDAAGASHITFLSNARLRKQVALSQAAALILSSDNYASLADSYGGACIITPNPYAYYAHVAQYFAQINATPVLPGVHPTAFVDPSARVAASA